MEVSKFTLTNNRIGSLQMELLRYIHELACDKPQYLKDTNLKVVSNRYAMATNSKLANVMARMRKLISNNLLTINYTKKGPSPRGNIHINYLNPAIPDEMRDTMSEEEKEFIKRVNERLEKAKEDNKDAYVDPDTQCVVSPSLSSEAPQTQESQVEEPEQAVPVAIKTDKNGVNITITLNLNVR